MNKLANCIIIFSLFFISCVSNNLWDEVNTGYPEFYPIITSICPENGDENTAPDQLPAVTFSKNMDEESVKDGFKLFIIHSTNSKESVAGDVIYDHDAKTVMFHPANDKLIRNSIYEVQLSEEIIDVDGLPLKPDNYELTYTFSTKDYPSIIVEKISPSADAPPSGIDAKIIITFSEEVNIDGNWEIQISGTGSIDDPIKIDKESDANQKSWTNGNTILTISNIDFRYGEGESQRKILVKLEKFTASVDNFDFSPSEYNFSFYIKSSWREIVEGLPEDKITATSTNRPIVLRKIGETPVIAYNTTNKIGIHQFDTNNEEWSPIGDYIENSGDGDIDLCESNGVFFVAYKSLSGKASASKLIPSATGSSSWLPLKINGSTDLSMDEIKDIQIASYGEKVFIAYTQLGEQINGSNTYELNILSGNETLEYITGFPVGQEEIKSHSISIAINGKSLYVQCVINNTIGYMVYSIPDMTWDKTIVSGSNYGVYHETSLSFLNNKPFVVYHGIFTNNDTYFSFDCSNGSTLVPYPTPDPHRIVIEGQNPKFDLIIEKNIPYFIFINDQNYVQYTFPTSNFKLWRGIGDAEDLEWKIISNDRGDFPSAIIRDGKLIVAYRKTSSSNIVVQQQAFDK